MDTNPFDDDESSYYALVNYKEHHSLWPSLPKFQLAGGWFAAKRTALRVWITSNRTGPIYGLGVSAAFGVGELHGTC
jgi:uncharacterized protein YbdZ (MbtH family)